MRVLTDDDGIRPAGEPDRCFYCRQKVGGKHATGCVMRCVPTRYLVVLNGVPSAEMLCWDPAEWDYQRRYDHYNIGTWCANNLHGAELNWRRKAPPWFWEDDGPCLRGLAEVIPLRIDEEPDWDADYLADAMAPSMGVSE